MRIALCTEIMYPVYGVEKRVYEMAKRLPEFGHDVTVYTSSPQAELPDIDIRQISHKTITKPPKRNYIYCAEFMLKLYKELVEGSYDIIDANGHLSLIPCSMAGLSRKKPVVATIHDIYLNQWSSMYNGFGSALGFPFELLFCKMPYTKILTLNSSLKKRMAQLLGMKDVDVVPSGISVKEIDKVRGEHKEKNIVLYVGRLVPQKNVDILLKAFACVENAELKIIGSGNELSNLKKLSSSLGIEKRVNFMGPLKSHENVIKEMKKASVVVMPSVRECFGIVPIEAMCCRTAVISTKTEGPMDYIKDGYNGLLVEIGKPEDLSRKINMVLSDGMLRAKLQANGRRTSEKYDWGIIVRRISEIYQELL